MNVIFLDFDGVRTRPQNALSDKHMGFAFDTKSVTVLKHILTKTNAKIVISSSGLILKSVESLRTLLAVYGIGAYVIDNLTDHLDNDLTYVKTIEQYSQNNGVKKYILIDDIRCDMHAPQQIKTELPKELLWIDTNIINQHIARLNA